MKTRFVIVLGVVCLGAGDWINASSDVITPRWGHTVTELADGGLLIAGGENDSGLIAGIEILDPVSSQTLAIDALGTLLTPRRRHAAVRLADGRVLLAGGEGTSGILDSAELIDPASGIVSEISLGAPRADHTATLLPDGRVLLAGGHDGVNTLASLQIFDPATNTVSAVTGGPHLAEFRRQHTATLLDDGRVLLIGGRNEFAALATTEYWDQATGTVTAGPVLSGSRFDHTATKIPRGHVAVVGGSGGNAPLATIELFSTDADAFVPAGSLAVPRAGHSAVVLPDNGHLMVLGGRSAEGPVAAVELLHPYQLTFMSLPPLDVPRSEFVSSIAGPYVWAVGGRSSAGGALGSVEAVPFATFTSDHGSYSPNSTVTLEGNFWLPGEKVTIEIVSSKDDPTTWVASEADANGTFVNTEFSTGSDGGVFYVATASGEQSGRRAALEFGTLILPPSDGWGLSPSEIAQTTNPVPLTITGEFQNGIIIQDSRCDKLVFGVCLERHYRTLHAGEHQVLVAGTRTDTNINLVLDSTWLGAGRIGVLLPTSVTSNADQYRVTVREQQQVIITCTVIGFIPCSGNIQRFQYDTGFVATLTVLPDSTPPLVSASVAGSLGSNNWHTGDVSITWSVHDPESPISSTSGCSDVSVVADTTGTTFTCTATSGGGTTTESVTIKRDASPPDATLSVADGTLGSNGWYVSPVTVRTTGSDTVSAPVTCTADKVQNADTTGSQFTGSCTNAANLTKEAAPLSIKVDKTVPTITATATPAANAAGWHQGNVTVAFTCADATSGIATCPAGQTLSAEGASASTPQVAIDTAGNTSPPSNIVAVKIDRTAPTVALNGGPAHGGSYYFGLVPAAPTCSGSDGLSGLETCIISGYGTTVGSHTVLATARDYAGHVSVQSATYTVLPWTFAGFYLPVEMGDVVNTVKGGSTVPITFEAFAGQTELVDPVAVLQPLKATQAFCGSADTNDIALVASGSTSLRYDATTGQFIYNWKTPKMPGYCYVVTVTLQDGTSRSAQFRMK